MRDMLVAAWLVIRVAWRTGPLPLIFTLGEVISTVLRFVQPVLVGLIVNGLADHTLERVAWGTGLLIASLAFGGALEALAVGYRVKLIQDVGYAFDKEIIQALSHIRELDRLEERRIANAIGKVRERADAMGFCFNGLMVVVIQIAAPITSICVAMSIDPRLLLLTLAGVPAILVSRRVAKLQGNADESAQPYASTAVAWAQLIANEDARAERKVFRLWDWYRNQLLAAVTRREYAFFGPVWFESVGSFLAEITYLACVAATLLWVLTTGNRISAGAVVAVLLVSLDLKGTLVALRFALSRFGPALRAAAAMREVQVAASTAMEGEASSIHMINTADSVCRLADVSYVHVGASAPALRNVDAIFRPGQVIAVVGENGAGKSTLVELLLGLRRPTEGRATLTSVKQSSIAQQFGRYEFRLAETVSLEDISNLSDADMARVRHHLHEASPRRFWEEHDEDIALQLGAGWPEGTGLSAGQWQATAAARCFHVEDAKLVVLDEPTAALDPEAQDAMTARYLALSRKIASRGGIAILVTHRMSMPILADHVIMLHEGEVVEAGTHDDLLALKGRYASAYHAVTSGFREMTRDAQTFLPTEVQSTPPDR